MSRKVLVVDDDARVRRLVIATLGEDYSLLEAADGSQALDIASREKPDVVLLDVKMPGMDGFEVCRRLKAGSATAQARVVMVTGLADDNDRNKGRKAGADAYFTKPFSPRALISLLEELLE